MLLWYRHCSNKTGGRVEEVLPHHGTEPLHLVRDAVVCPGQRVEVCMDTLSTLLTHEPKSHPPLLNPWSNMLLQNVHFGKYSGMLEIASVVPHEFFDVIT